MQENTGFFYVALTRLRKQTLLLTVENNKSIFANELESDYKYLTETNTELKRNIYKGPKCGGKLIMRSGKYGFFIGCSNFPKCRYMKK